MAKETSTIPIKYLKAIESFLGTSADEEVLNCIWAFGLELAIQVFRSKKLTTFSYVKESLWKSFNYYPAPPERQTNLIRLEIEEEKLNMLINAGSGLHREAAVEYVWQVMSQYADLSEEGYTLMKVTGACKEPYPADALQVVYKNMVAM